ncbi:hypothetical protein QE152_g14418 [Popillia japonica]|uniref:MATH domain-containing protein n=1 Tax=Popillia japonica TaxID=7064 RepID=A0AAW1L6Z6_POPJA
MKNNLKRKVFIDSSSSESDVELEKICNDSTDDSSSESDVELEKICNDSTDDSITEENEVPNESLSEGNFVLVKFYVAKIEKIENLDYYLTYLTKGLGWTFTYPEKNLDYYLTYLTKGLGWTFTYPEKKDDDVKKREDIVMKLPKPKISGGTERASRKFKFNVDLTDFSVYWCETIYSYPF